MRGAVVQPGPSGLAPSASRRAARPAPLRTARHQPRRIAIVPAASAELHRLADAGALGGKPAPPLPDAAAVGPASAGPNSSTTGPLERASGAGTVLSRDDTPSSSNGRHGGAARPHSMAAMADTLQQLKAELNDLATAAEAAELGAAATADLEDQPPEAGLPPSADLRALEAAAAGASPAGIVVGAGHKSADREKIKTQWKSLMRWSKWFRRQERLAAQHRVSKVVVFGGGSFGTAMGAALARHDPAVRVTLLLRDPGLAADINQLHRNTRYLKDFELPRNVDATTDAAEALAGAQYAIHAVPVQHTRAFLQSIKAYIPPSLPLISVSKGVEVASGQVMSELIPSALGRRQPTAYLSGPSFAAEVMDGRPTGIVAASKDKALARAVQRLFASPSMRVSLSTDVVGVEVCGALKNVLAIAAGIVEGLELGSNAMAALISQGCSEIRWLAEKMGAKPATVAGLSGMGDIMLTCYGALSRNRAVGLRLGRGEALADILASSSQVAEGVATAGTVVALARRYRVQLPVLTAVAQVVEGHLSPREAVNEIMRLPQVEER